MVITGYLKLIYSSLGLTWWMNPLKDYWINWGDTVKDVDTLPLRLLLMECLVTTVIYSVMSISSYDRERLVLTRVLSKGPLCVWSVLYP